MTTPRWYLLTDPFPGHYVDGIDLIYKDLMKGLKKNTDYQIKKYQCFCLHYNLV